ncbi:MAG: phosphohistidine phosphatase [Betaproteobacteria bacterium SG8_41]|nr:MAG: phosphohistidine phosphatase [Betaproteobacteria bacterium SG8_41]
MDLILWRHADAEDGIPDDGRRLTAKGEKQARRVAKWLAQHLPADARVLVSPAKRAQQTAKALSKDFETCPEVGTATVPAALLKAAGWPDRDGTVLVVGHQPVIGQTVAILLTGEAREWAFKKGAIWWLSSRERGEVVVRAVIAPDLL